MEGAKEELPGASATTEQEKKLRDTTTSNGTGEDTSAVIARGDASRLPQEHVETARADQQRADQPLGFRDPLRLEKVSSSQREHESESTGQDEDREDRNVDRDPSLVSASFARSLIPRIEKTGPASSFRDVDSKNGDEPPGSWDGHDIRTVAPKIDHMSHVMGVDPAHVRSWVVKNLENNTDTKETIFRQIVQIIENKKGSPMAPGGQDRLRNELANRALEAQGRAVPPDDEELAPATKLAGDDPRRLRQVTREEPTAEEIRQFTSDTWRDVPITPKGMLSLLQGMGRGDLVPNFLIENVKEEETNCQKIYDTALEELRAISSEVATELAAENLPGTEEELKLFLVKYNELIYLSRMNFRDFCLFLFPLAALPSLALCTHSAALGRLAREKSSSA